MDHNNNNNPNEEDEDTQAKADAKIVAQRKPRVVSKTKKKTKDDDGASVKVRSIMYRMRLWKLVQRQSTSSCSMQGAGSRCGNGLVHLERLLFGSIVVGELGKWRYRQRYFDECDCEYRLSTTNKAESYDF